jgi:hypothetical protein
MKEVTTHQQLPANLATTTATSLTSNTVGKSHSNSSKLYGIMHQSKSSRRRRDTTGN